MKPASCIRALAAAAVVTVALAAATGASAAAVTADHYTVYDWRTQTPTHATFERLRAVASAHHSVRTLAGVQARSAAEATLDADALAAQRDEIAAARQALLSALPGATFRITRSYRRLPVVGLELTPAGLDALEAAQRAAWLQQDRLAQASLSQTTPIVESTEANALGLTGAGQTVAIVDTGVDSSHPFFGGRVVGEACFADQCPGGIFIGPGTGQPCTFAPMGCQHGTHVAGIAAGDSKAAGVDYSGVAPGASIVSIDVFSSVADPDCKVASEAANCPETHQSDELAALDYVLATADTYHYAAVNLSFGSTNTHYQGFCDAQEPLMSVAIMWLRAAGIATVIAAGNESVKNGLSVPACSFWAISVGATTNNDAVPSWSNSTADLKLLAPGGDFVKSSVPVSAGMWGWKWGTSMATPHVTGAFAVLRQHAPNASVLGLTLAMQAAGKPVQDPANGVTLPRLRLLNALVALSETGARAHTAKELPGGRVVSAGVGLKRTDGQPASGTIGILRSALPEGTKTEQALLYWMTVGTGDPSLVFDGHPVNGTLIGAARGPCVDGATRVYRADVSGIVAGAGAYEILGAGRAPGFAEGASLVLVTSEVGKPTRRIMLRDGAASTVNLTDTLTVTFPLTKAVSRGELHTGIGDGNSGDEEPLKFGATPITPASFFSGADGAAWDDVTAPLKGAFAAPTVDMSLREFDDCLAWAYTTVSHNT